ncbi:MAG: CoA-binding protein [Chloroflexi bacterium]|nr:MAG: CoA-binding protein [Chloroflexota bacterium]
MVAATGKVLSHDGAAQREILKNAKVIAVVGHSDKPHRTSYRIAQFLRLVGYTVYPVNPEIDSVDGEKSYPSLADVPEPIDIVNVFRQPHHLPSIVDEAAAAGAPTVWAQLGVHHPHAVEKALQHGLNIITDTCIKVAYAEFIGV